MKNLLKSLFMLSLTVITFTVSAQETKNTVTNSFIKDRKFYLNEDGSNYIKFTLLTQAWLRNMDYNPGTTIFGITKKSGTDIGIRRYRMQFYGQLTDKVFVYSQFGENNYNNISDRKQGFFVHDALGEYALDKSRLSLGIGLTAWSGLSRFASPSVGTLLGVDAPLFQQTTNDVTDQFLRKLSIYAKGKLGKFDYRLVMSQPMAIQKSAGYSGTINANWAFSAAPPKMQWNGYFQYQFKDQESNTTPYNTGTYLGKKKVLNIGAGFIFQKDAMWKLNTVGDTINHTMTHISADIYYDAPIGTKGQSVSAYGSITHYDFGDKYTRNSGPMNPANGNNNPTILNGAGNSFPMYGTGTIFYGQVGYKLKENLIGQTTLMPYVSLQHANYGKLNDAMNFYDIGVNWLLSNHTSKLTISYQDRPVFNTSGDQVTRKGAVIAQYQIYFN